MQSCHSSKLFRRNVVHRTDGHRSLAFFCLPSINSCLPQRPIPEAGNWSTLAPVSVAGANCFLGTLACRWSMKNRRELNIPGAYKLAAEQKSALIVFFADDAISGLRGCVRIVSTSDLMPKQRRAAVDSRQVIYQLPIEGLPDSRAWTSVPMIERCGRSRRPERHRVEARCTSRISSSANSGYALAHTP